MKAKKLEDLDGVRILLSAVVVSAGVGQGGVRPAHN